MIPGGMTIQLQSLNVLVNKPFKDYLRKEYEAQLLLKNFPLTPSSKMKRPSDSKFTE
jgi:hypothetical protein